MATAYPRFPAHTSPPAKVGIGPAALLRYAICGSEGGVDRLAAFHFAIELTRRASSRSRPRHLPLEAPAAHEMFQKNVDDAVKVKVRP